MPRLLTTIEICKCCHDAPRYPQAADAQAVQLAYEHDFCVHQDHVPLARGRHTAWHALLYAKANAVTQRIVVGTAAYLLLCLP